MVNPPDVRFLNVGAEVIPIHDGADIIQVVKPNGTTIWVLKDEYEEASSELCQLYKNGDQNGNGNAIIQGNLPRSAFLPQEVQLYRMIWSIYPKRIIF